MQNTCLYPAEVPSRAACGSCSSAVDAKLVCALKAICADLTYAWDFVCIYLRTLCSFRDITHVSRLQDSAATGFAHDEEVLESSSGSFPIVTPSGKDFGREDIWLWEYIPARLREKVTGSALSTILRTGAACCVIWYCMRVLLTFVL